MASRSTIRTTGQKELSSALQVLTNSATAFISKDCVIFQLVFNNKTGGAVTVTVTDQAGTPLDLLTTVSLPANSLTVVAFPEGQYMPGGFKWSASAGTSINASVVGFYAQGLQ